MRNKIALIFTLLFLSWEANAETLDRYLPKKIGDNEISIKFSVDSTWHLVEGKTSGLSGSVGFVDETKQKIQGQVILPVKKMDTDLSMRDEKMYRVMKAEVFPEIEFALEEVDKLCEEEQLAGGVACQIELIGKLTIAGVSKQLRIPAILQEQGKNLIISGKTSLKWKDYGIEDPSILVAKLNDTATVDFLLTFLPNK
jgi:polyisoprenoid-binding protein YceI